MISMPAKKKDYENYSTNMSTKPLHPVIQVITEELSNGPMKAGELKESVMKKARVSAAQYYKMLRKTRDDDVIIEVSTGRRRYYSLPKHAEQLAKMSSKHGPLEKHVIDNASRLMDKLINASEEDIRTLVTQSLILSSAVEALRSAHPKLPTAPRGCSDPTTTSISLALVGRSGPGNPVQTMAMVWYGYLVDVLKALGEF